ncbi:MAG: hypothetical protein EOP38_02160 [Rubrivivax sp.]|nr:MAG: hypothetical protein EOP38_02160 [Rubrivivax sp.]
MKTQLQENFVNRFSLIASACVAAITLTACGGGGGSTAPAIPVTTAAAESVNTTNPTTPGSTTGTTPGTPTTSTPTPVVVAPPPVVTTPDIVDSSPSWTPAVSAMVATFENDTDKVANWVFYAGLEFPGANGSLYETPGISGKGAALQYDLGCGTPTFRPSNDSCGRYVAANFRLPAPLPVGSTDRPTISVDIRNLQGVAAPSLRVVDGSGQTLQFPMQIRTLEYSGAAAGWRSVQIPVGKSTTYWGGDNNGIFRGPLKSVSIMASSTLIATPPGTLEIDNVALLKSPDNTFELKANAPLSNIAFPTTYVGRLGAGVRTTAHLDKLKAAGITVVRKDLRWDGVERNGVFDFARYDELVTELDKRGMSILWIMDYGHPDHGGSAPRSDADQSAYAEFGRQAALRYKSHRVTGYEVWNEPNTDLRWPSPDPVLYASLVNKTVRAIHLADPNAKVSTGGLANMDTDFLMKMLNTGKLTGVNAIGMHPYRKTAPETYASEISPLQQLIASKGLNVQLWDTEWGYSSFEDIDARVYGNGHDPRARRRQGNLVLRKVLTQLALNAPITIIFDLFDSGTNPNEREHNFGLLANDGTDKPGMIAMRTLFSAQNGRIFKGFLPDVPPGLHVLRWDGSADRAFALWTDTNDRKVTVQLPSTIKTVVRWDGTAVQPTVTATGRSVVMSEADGPLFVTMSN